jgi:predicted phosphodiesterase
MSGGILIYGDPHGEWRPLLRAVTEERPDGVVILGDCDLAVPLREQLKPLFDAGIRVRWIHGNHDNDREDWHGHLWEDYPEGSLHGRWSQVGDMIVAGVGGIFKERVWYPRFEMADPIYASRRDYLRRQPRSDRWRGGLALRQRDTIFPEDIDALRGWRADVLVTHEAPSCHRHGFIGLDVAASLCAARLLVHGHHHESYEAVLQNGTKVRGLGRAEVLRLRREDLG